MCGGVVDGVRGVEAVDIDTTVTQNSSQEQHQASARMTRVECETGSAANPITTSCSHSLADDKDGKNDGQQMSVQPRIDSRFTKRLRFERVTESHVCAAGACETGRYSCVL
jgi:hypothetical protein